MLPSDSETNVEQKLQYTLYQLQVWNKLMVQYARSVDSGNTKRKDFITDLMYEYGKIQITEVEFELERLLLMQDIFETARDLK